MSRRSINLEFAPCDVCGKKNGAPGHDCDGGDALRKAARELFGPVLDLVEPMLVKAGTGILRGVFEVAFERDALKSQNVVLVSALTKIMAGLPEIQPCDRSYEMQMIASAALSKPAREEQPEEQP